MNSFSSEFLKELSKIDSLAHHPTCEKFQNHWIKIFNKHFCVGCSMVLTGILVGVSLLLRIFNQLNVVSIFALGILLYLPTLFQLKIKGKMFKMFSRFSLGVGISILLSGIFLKITWDSSLNILLKIIGILIFYTVFNNTLEIRNKHIDKPCTTCAEGFYPFCSHKKDELKNLYHKYKNQLNEENQNFSGFLKFALNQMESGQPRKDWKIDFSV